MKKWVVILVILAGAGFAAHRIFFHRSDAAKAYQEFAEALARQNYDRAIELSDGPARAQLQSLNAQWKKYALGATYSIVGTSYKVDSERKKGDEVDLQMTQVVRVNGGGQESAFGRASASVHHARLKKGTAGWRVISYEEKLID